MKQKLTLSMGLLYLIVILCLGLIVINEKSKIYKMPAVEKKLKEYVKENYKEEFDISKIKFDYEKYSLKVKNKKNNNLYFYVYYQDKKITSTYNKDYKEGKTLINYMNNYQNKKKTKNTFDKYNVKYNIKLNKINKSIKNELINGNYNLNIYTIQVEDNYSDLKNKLTEILKYTNSIKLNPKDYNITLYNSKEYKKNLNINVSSDIMNSSIDTLVNAINTNDINTLKLLNVKVKEG